MRIKKNASVNKDCCVACGSCMQACPRSAIHIEQGCFAEVNVAKCVGCGLCTRVCPGGCISLVEVGGSNG